MLVTWRCCAPCLGFGGPCDVWLVFDPILEGFLDIGRYRCKIGWEMVEFAWVVGTMVSFKCAATAHECKVGGFGWVGKDWTWVRKFH